MEELITQLGLDWKLILAQVVNFGIVAGVLAWFVFSPLMSFLNNREKEIKEGLEMKEKAEHEMQRVDDARKRALQESKEEAQRMLTEARNKSLEKEREILSEATLRAERIVEKSQEQAQRDREELMRKSKGEMSSLAMMAAEYILSKRMTKEDHDRMAKEVSEYLDKQNIGS